MSSHELTAKLLEYKQYKRLKEEAEAAMKALQEQITAHMEQQGTTEITVDIYRVTYKPVTSTRLNTTALKSARPDLFTQFSTTTTSKRFTVA